MPCSSDEHFVVPWLLQHEWVTGVEFAHRVFGGMVLAQSVVWMVLFLGFCPLHVAYLLSGVATCACGVWLAAWVALLLKPQVPTALLLQFMRQDLTQLQHMTMSVLLLAAGAAELYFAALLCARPRRESDALRWPHAVWGVCAGWVGLIFIAHPQHSASETAMHVVLGTSLLLGAVFLTAEKRRGKLDEDQDFADAPMSILAAVCFGVAAVLLCTFSADDGGAASGPLSKHAGIGTACHVGYPAALVGLGIGLCSCLAVLAAAVRLGVTVARRRRRGPLVSHQDLAPTADTFGCDRAEPKVRSQSDVYS